MSEARRKDDEDGSVNGERPTCEERSSSPESSASESESE